jgi:hypothetical protein
MFDALARTWVRACGWNLDLVGSDHLPNLVGQRCIGRV